MHTITAILSDTSADLAETLTNIHTLTHCTRTALIALPIVVAVFFAIG